MKPGMTRAGMGAFCALERWVAEYPESRRWVRSGRSVILQVRSQGVWEGFDQQKSGASFAFAAYRALHQWQLGLKEEG